MRIKSRITVRFKNEDDAKYALKILPGNNASPFYIFNVFNDTDEYRKLMDFITHPSIASFHVIEDEVFSQSELLSAPMLRMVPNGHRGGYPQPEAGGRDKNFLSVSYDMQSGCSHCSNGLLQNRPLRLRSNTNLGKTLDISGIHWLREYIVSKKLKELIELAGLTGCEFWPIVKHGTNTHFEDIFQLKITGNMPPMAAATEIVTTSKPNSLKCSCGIVSVNGSVHYHAHDLADTPDFALTQEWLGGNDECWRWPFMSQRAYRLFLDNNIRGIRYYPPAFI